MKRLKLVIGVCILYLFVVFGGTGLMMHLDKQFYGEVRAEEVKVSEPQYRVVYVFPDDDKLTKLVIVHDPVLDVYCYTLKNRPYKFKTGLNCFPGWYIRNESNKTSMMEDWLEKIK